MTIDSREDIERKLFKSIPILTNMGVKLGKYEKNEIIVSAPLDDHYNYEGTAFGGSLNTIALLPCFLMARRILDENNHQSASLVIQDSETKYLRPVQGNFKAVCRIEAQEAQSFVAALERRNRARIELVSSLSLVGSEEELVRFKGRFVAGKEAAGPG